MRSKCGRLTREIAAGYAYAELIKTLSLASRAQRCSDGVARSIVKNAESALARYKALGIDVDDARYREEIAMLRRWLG